MPSLLTYDTFLQPLMDLLHATSLDERRCVLCGLPFSPRDPGEAQPLPEDPGSLPLCPACRQLLHPRTGGYCPDCGGLHALSDTAPTRCAECIRNPPPWEHLRFYGVYGGALKTLLLRGKFGADPNLLNLLGHFLVNICRSLPHPDAIIPVPLHKSRLHERGFNQSMELSRPLALALNAPLLPELLIRRIATPHQIGLSQEERRANLRMAFVALPEVRDKRLLLVDDTYTTGTTLRRCTRALLDAGARAVDVAVVARTARATVIPSCISGTKESQTV